MKYKHPGPVKMLAIKISNKLVGIVDSIIDYTILGCSLQQYVPTPFRETHGSTGSQATPYMVLRKIFEGYSFSDDDAFIDIGCGKGRVLAFLAHRGFPGKLFGVEMNPPVAEYVARWATRYDNVRVICDDVFNLNMSQFNFFFLFRPFMPDTFYRFVNKMESELTHAITLFYYADRESGNYLDNRKGWHILQRGKIWKINGLFVAVSPQRCSVWRYEPSA